MTQELIIALISLISGGGITAIVKLVTDYFKGKKEQKLQNFDDRVHAWQRLSERHESRVNFLEKKLESYERDFMHLERYIISLEQALSRTTRPEDMPTRPKLERETIKFFWDPEVNR